MKHGLKGPFMKLTPFGGLLATLPSEERFREFRARLGMLA